MEIMTKFPGVIYRDDYWEDKPLSFDVQSDFWDSISASLKDAGFKPGDEIIITISKNVSL